MNRSGSFIGKVLLVAAIIVIILLLVCEFGVRFFIASEAKKALSKNGGSESASISFGSKPVLAGLIVGKLPHMEVEVPNSLDITYPDGDSSAPVIKGTPAATIEIENLDLQSRVAGSLQFDAMLPTDYLLAAAQGGAGGVSDEEKKPAEDSPIKITNVRPNPSKGVLTFEISGGLATMDMKPVVNDGRLDMQVSGATLLGMSLPQAVVDSLANQVGSASELSDSNLKTKLVEVTSRGMRVVQTGDDVSFDEISDSADKVLGNKGSTGNAEGAAALPLPGESRSKVLSLAA